MPLTTGYESITSTTGNITQVIVAEQTNYRTPVSITAGQTATVANGFYQFQPRINSADIAREGTTIASSFFDGSSAQSKDAPGPLDIANGLSIALSGNGTALPLRMLTQDKNPAWNIYGGAGQTIPNAVTVVSSTNLTTGAKTVADDLSSTTNPVQLVVTPASGTATGRAIIQITGTDNADSVITETIAYPAGSTIGTATTRLWFKTVTAVSTSGFSGGTFAITATDRSAQVIFQPQDEELVAFWTGEITKGNVPNVYDGLCMQNATIDITRDGLVAFDCTFLGRQGRLYTNLAGQQGNPATGVAPLRTELGSDVQLASPDVYGGWQTRITAENTDLQVAAQESTLTINQELEYTNVLGEQFQVTQPARGDKRLVQLESTVVYARENNYSSYFEGNVTLPNVKVTWRQRGLGAYPYELTLEIPEAQLTADPDPAVADTGTITQNVVLKAIKPANVDYEYRFIARYSNYPVLSDLS